MLIISDGFSEFEVLMATAVMSFIGMSIIWKELESSLRLLMYIADLGGLLSRRRDSMRVQA